MYDRCIICHRKLIGDESRRRGLGPVCYARVHKIQKEAKAKREANKIKTEIFKNQVSIEDMLQGKVPVTGPMKNIPHKRIYHSDKQLGIMELMKEGNTR